MFKIVKTDRYTWPVKVSIATDGGRYEDSTFDVVFKRLSKPEVDDMRNKLFKDDADAAVAARSVVVGWNGIEDSDGPIPFSDSALDNVLAIQGVAPAIVGAFFESVLGAPRKN
ncbi:MAG TPA: hypothetical protein PLT25_02100 [Acidocella sp.]|nr:hypothetical protein [Acidocella sp.]